MFSHRSMPQSYYMKMHLKLRQEPIAFERVIGKSTDYFDENANMNQASHFRQWIAGASDEKVKKTCGCGNSERFQI